VSAWLRQTRVRLGLAYMGIFTVVTLVAAGTLTLVMARIEYSAIDNSLASDARSTQSSIAAGGALPGSGTAADGPGQGGGLQVATLLFDTNANLLDRSGQGPPTSALESAVRQAAASGVPALETLNVNGEAQRVLAKPISSRAGENRVLVVARPRAEADQVVATTATVLILGVVVLMIAATVLGYGLAGTALRPVREIVAAARSFSEQDLHRRIDMELPSDEIGELADTFNAMLARLETAFESLRRFTADAAHELRAPLTLIRTEAEVTLSRPRSPEEYQASLSTVLAEAQRLGRTADQLLMLARAEAGALIPQANRVDLSSLVEDAVRMWQPLASERRVAILVNAAEGGPTRGDVDLLRRLLDNLIDNALRYAPVGSDVVVACSRVGRSWELTISDSGPGVPESARASIFERFSRADQARARDTGGAGLGLALCAAIAHLHGGSIRLDDQPGAGARFVVDLPDAGAGTMPAPLAVSS